MRKILAVLCCVLPLCSCMVGNSPMATFYTLQTETGTPVSSKRISIGINPIDFPSAQDRVQMMNYFDNGQVEISEMNRWVEPMGRLFQRILISDMYSTLPNAVIKNRLSSREMFDRYLSVQVNRFTTTFGGESILDVVWTLRDEKGKVMTEKREVLTAESGMTYADSARTKSALLYDLARIIAKASVK